MDVPKPSTMSHPLPACCEHGGDITGYLDEQGALPLDFSADISPLGLPPAVVHAVTSALSDADRYPDASCRHLRAAIAATEDTVASHVVCGNGAADLIYRLGPALHPSRALVCAPTFQEYERALQLWGCQVDHHPLCEKDGFAVTEAMLGRITDQTDLVFLCQPNNPTGIVCDRDLVLAMLQRCEACGSHLVVDESFVDFLDDPTVVSVHDEVEAHPALIVLKSFTKLFAMPGIRLGYCLCSDPAVVCALQLAGQPWAVSNLAQAAGMAACRECDSYVEQLRGLIAVERAFLKAGLMGLGIPCTGEANFLFFHLDGDPASRHGDGDGTRIPRFVDAMRDRGILVRDCSGFPGLREGYHRIAVRNHADNVQILQAMREVLAPAHGLMFQAPDVFGLGGMTR